MSNDRQKTVGRLINELKRLSYISSVKYVYPIRYVFVYFPLFLPLPSGSRVVVWHSKNHKYFKKRKLNNEFQSFFLLIFCFQKFILISKCCIILSIKMCIKCLDKKTYTFFKQLHVF